MKNLKKFLAIALVIAMALSLAACGGFAGKMAKAAKKLEKAKSYSTSTDVDMQIAVNFMGMEMAVDVKVNSDTDVFKDPAKVHGNLKMNAFEEAEEFEYYMVPDGDGYKMLMSDDGENWAEEHVEASDAKMYQSVDFEQVMKLLKMAESFEKTGEETIRDSKATVYSGSVSGKDVGELLGATGMDAMLDQMDFDVTEEIFNSIENIPVTIAIDNTSGMISQYTIDATELVQKTVEKALAEQGANTEYGISIDLSGAMKVKNALVKVEMYNYDQVADFEIPSVGSEA